MDYLDRLDRYCTKEACQIVNKHKDVLNSISHQEMQIKL